VKPPSFRIPSALAALRFPERVGWRDQLVGAAIAFVYAALLVASAHSLGFTRDETFYFRAASSYWGWWYGVFEHGLSWIDRHNIDAAFSDNHEHPALMKTLFGFSHWLFYERWHLFADETTAYRFPAMVMAGVALWTAYLFGARAWSRPAGLVAATLLAAMPRVFFHAHLACFDVPIMTMWIVCTYAHWRAQERGAIGWAIATGVLFGLALDTKHNAWMLPAVLVPHAFFVHRHAVVRGLRLGRLAIPTSLVSMAVLGPAVFLLLWPYLWFDTIARIQWWVDFHLNHTYYNIEFFGHNVYEPPAPRLYLPVMIAGTVPAVTLVLFFTGLAAAVRGWALRLRAWAVEALAPAKKAPGTPEDAAAAIAAEGAPLEATAERPHARRLETDVLLALSFLVAIGPFLLPKTPIFGGTKHWLTAYPALALFAGRGFVAVREAMRRALLTAARLPAIGALPPAAFEAALFVSVTLAPILVTAHAHPFGLSSYVPLVGGTAGGADLGLNRQFWGFTTQDAAEEYLNAHAPPGSSVFILDTTYDAWIHMQEEGRVRSDLRAAGAPQEANFSLVQHELHMNEVDYSIWMAYGTTAPIYVVTHDGVPIVSVYKHP
jgi:4-amino-4-deoxy-L-arabinose transferase-like glycosyltransferase